MDLIDRKEVMEDLSLAFAFHAYAGAVAESIVKAQPAVDAMPVVRCKDCKWCSHFTDGHIECRLIYDLKPVPRTYMQMREGDFCSYGERREETDNENQDHRN